MIFVVPLVLLSLIFLLFQTTNILVAVENELLKYRDTGLGTIDKLDRELIILDEIAYQVKAYGTVLRANSDDTIPFSLIYFNDSSRNLKKSYPYMNKIFFFKSLST